ncbi:MAG: hypothetical protein ACFFC7_09490 [Candidatus Hermodarchaeota archaeon]
MYLLRMEAEILTPIITKRTVFYMKSCKWLITKPRRRVYNKINSGVPMFPYSYFCYLGTLEVGHRCSTKRKARKKLYELVQIDQIGRYQNNGMGVINWIGGQIEKYKAEEKKMSYRVKIRKGLPHNLTKEQQEIIKMALLHDFVHTKKHKSKIYKELDLEDKKLVELLRLHHDNTGNPKIRQIQKYDQIASIITRKVKSHRLDRYNWQAKVKVDFEALAQEIAEASDSVWKLYDYIYNSKKLDLLNESLQYGHTSLRYHLLVMANLLVQSFQHAKD